MCTNEAVESGCKPQFSQLLAKLVLLNTILQWLCNHDPLRCKYTVF